MQRIDEGQWVAVRSIGPHLCIEVLFYLQITSSMFGDSVRSIFYWKSGSVEVKDEPYSEGLSRVFLVTFWLTEPEQLETSLSALLCSRSLYEMPMDTCPKSNHCL